MVSGNTSSVESISLTVAGSTETEIYNNATRYSIIESIAEVIQAESQIKDQGLAEILAEKIVDDAFPDLFQHINTYISLSIEFENGLQYPIYMRSPRQDINTVKRTQIEPTNEFFTAVAQISGNEEQYTSEIDSSVIRNLSPLETELFSMIQQRQMLDPTPELEAFRDYARKQIPDNSQ